jgi:hypothetical protein
MKACDEAWGQLFRELRRAQSRAATCEFGASRAKVLSQDKGAFFKSRTTFEKATKTLRTFRSASYK